MTFETRPFTRCIRCATKRPHRETYKAEISVIEVTEDQTNAKVLTTVTGRACKDEGWCIARRAERGPEPANHRTIVRAVT